jgi:hypothetical protein
MRHGLNLFLLGTVRHGLGEYHRSDFCKSHAIGACRGVAIVTATPAHTAGAPGVNPLRTAARVSLAQVGGSGAAPTLVSSVRSATFSPTATTRQPQGLVQAVSMPRSISARATWIAAARIAKPAASVSNAWQAPTAKAVSATATSAVMSRR